MKPRRKSSAPKPAEPKRVLKTLDRALSRLGFCSRTEAAEWIRGGRVRVNGRAQTDPETWVDLDRDRITVDGRPLAPSRRIYLLLYKPKGYLTTWRDPQGRPTVYDLLGKLRQWIFPVGRLDLDTSGLLLMTNDSEFAELISNPDYHVPKTYLVKASTLLSDAQLAALRHGVELKDGRTRPAEVIRLRDSGGRTFFEITITEGRNRQVRRMVEAVGSKVLKLVRTAIGPVRIGSLEIGKWRTLTPAEVRALTECAKRGARRAAKEQSRRLPPEAV
ncbi:MAG: rRNA pseudouridine synthase [Bryobacteraceae bacterium]|nr:rRNA pseudouridine synthase [Bryobacteraceae bacterium]